MSLPDLTIEQINAINRSIEQQTGITIDDDCRTDDDDLRNNICQRKLGILTVKALETDPIFSELDPGWYDSYCDRFRNYVEMNGVLKYKELDIFV